MFKDSQYKKVVKSITSEFMDWDIKVNWGAILVVIATMITVYLLFTL